MATSTIIIVRYISAGCSNIRGMLTTIKKNHKYVQVYTKPFRFLQTVEDEFEHANYLTGISITRLVLALKKILVSLRIRAGRLLVIMPSIERTIVCSFWNRVRNILYTLCLEKSLQRRQCKSLWFLTYFAQTFWFLAPNVRRRTRVYCTGL